MRLFGNAAFAGGLQIHRMCEADVLWHVDLDHNLVNRITAALNAIRSKLYICSNPPAVQPRFDQFDRQSAVTAWLPR
jgi:hypothetical protein